MNCFKLLLLFTLINGTVSYVYIKRYNETFRVVNVDVTNKCFAVFKGYSEDCGLTCEALTTNHFKFQNNVYTVSSGVYRSANIKIFKTYELGIKQDERLVNMTQLDNQYIATFENSVNKLRYYLIPRNAFTYLDKNIQWFLKLTKLKAKYVF